MTGRRSMIATCVAMGLFVAASGCSTVPWLRRTATPSAPIAFQQPPDALQIVETLNRNAAKIRSIQADGVTISAAGMPSLRGSFVLERPRKLRLQASMLGLGATQVDVGSNDDFFWAAVPEIGGSPTVYYLRQAELADPQAQRALTADPDWLLEALGLLELDPTIPYMGPYGRPGGAIEIRSRTPFAGIQAIRVLAIHPQQGWVEESAYYTPEGTLLAKAVASGHRYDPATETALPTRIQVQVPAYALSAQMDVGNYAINRPIADPERVFTMPRQESANYVDVIEQMRLNSPQLFSRVEPAEYPPNVDPQAAHSPGEVAEREAQRVEQVTRGLRGYQMR